MLDAISKTFVVYIVIWEQEKMPMHSKRQTQIKAQVGALLFNKALPKIPTEYSNYNNVFSAEYATKLLESTGINKHAIKLEKSQ